MKLETGKALLLSLILFAVWQLLYPLGLDELLAYTIILAVLGIFLILDRQKLVTLGFRRPVKWKNYVGVGFLLACVFVLYLAELGPWLYANALPFEIQPVILTVNLGPLSILYVAALAIVIALVEETSFRGYVLRNLVLSYSRRTALLLSAILFAIYHISFYYISTSPLPPSRTFTYFSSFILYAFVGGIFLGYLYLNNQQSTVGALTYHSSIIFIQSFVPFGLAFNNAVGHVFITIPVLIFIYFLHLLRKSNWV